jgi:hypothetical protein
MTDSIRSAYEVARQQLKTPLWTFSGLALVAILVSLLIAMDKRNDEANLRYVEAPEKDDIFKLKTADGSYVLALVERVKSDSVYIRYSDYETKRITGLAALKRKGKNIYSAVTFGYHKTELKQMLESGEIVDIDRE